MLHPPGLEERETHPDSDFKGGGGLLSPTFARLGGQKSWGVGLDSGKTHPGRPLAGHFQPQASVSSCQVGLAFSRVASSNRGWIPAPGFENVAQKKKSPEAGLAGSRAGG